MKSVFDKPRYQSAAYPHRYDAQLVVTTLAGGIPTTENVAEEWLKSKLGDKDDLIREQVAEVMVERGVTADEAAKIVDVAKHLNGFKRDRERNGELYIEGRQLKACIKEAASVARAVNKLPARWGLTNKGILGFVAEHIFVVEDRLHLGVTEPTGVVQRFISTFRGTGIQYEEYVDDAKIDFTVISDHAFKADEWAALWLTAEQQGLGASRSQGFGRFAVTRWAKAS